MLRLPLTAETKFKLFLDLEWIFARLAHDLSLRYYEPSKHPWRRRENCFLLDRITRDHRVLDLGCAKGEVTNLVAARAKQTVGVDYKQELIEQAKERFGTKNLEFICGDAMKYLESFEEKFDVLILSHILEHIDGPELFLSRFKDYFDLIYIEVPDFDSNLLNHYRQDLGLQLNYNDSDHVSEFDRSELKQIFENCGLQIEEAEFVLGVQRYWCRVT